MDECVNIYIVDDDIGSGLTDFLVKPTRLYELQELLKASLPDIFQVSVNKK